MNTYTTVPSGEQVVQELPWRWKVQGRIFLIGGLGFMFDAWDVTLNGILIPLLSKHWSLSPGDAAWIGTANLIGMALGAFVWGTIADTIGRKKAFTATLLIFSIFTVLGAFSPDFMWFVVFRFLAGFGLGGCIPVDYALVGEFTPRKQRGRVLTAMDGWWPIGAALCGFVSAGLVAAFADWRLTMLVMVLPALLVFWIRRSVPESPLFLIRKGRRDEAAKVIDGLVEATGAEPRVYSLPAPQDAPRLSAGSAWTQLRALWQFNWKITTAAWALFFSILLVYYLSLTWMPRILIGAGFEEYKAFLTTASMAAVGLLGVVVAALLVERVGRKWILAITGPLSALTLVIVAIVVDIPPPPCSGCSGVRLCGAGGHPRALRLRLRAVPHGTARLRLRLGLDVLPPRRRVRAADLRGVPVAGAGAGDVVRAGRRARAAVRAVDGVLRPRNQATPARVAPHPPDALSRQAVLRAENHLE